MRLRLSRLVVLWGLVVLVGWMAYRSLPVQAQGSARGGTSGRVQLLCDLAQAIQWPATNRVLAVALVQYSDSDAQEIQRILQGVPRTRWGGLWFTNFSVSPTDKHLGVLPGCGILAINGTKIGGNMVPRMVGNLPSRAFLTFGDGFSNPVGMVDVSPEMIVTVNRQKLETAGFQLPSALVDEYRRAGVRVNVK